MGLPPTTPVAEKLVRKDHALPRFKPGSRLFLSLSDPTNRPAPGQTNFHARLSPEAVLVGGSTLAHGLQKAPGDW